MNELKYFGFTHEVIDNKPESEYLIMCANINSDDSWVWKFAPKPFNFIPVWSNNYESIIIGSNLENEMKRANDWIHGLFGDKELRKDRLYPVLYLLKIK